MNIKIYTWWIASLVGFIVSFIPTTQIYAHEVRPALLSIEERDTGWFDVTWKVPTRGNQPLPITPRLPTNLQLIGSPSVRRAPGAQIERTVYKNNGETLAGEVITFDGLSALQTDVLLNIRLQDGTAHSTILRPGSPKYTIPVQASKFEVAISYTRMGIIHILEGVDHLLFVFALLLLLSGFWLLLKTITAFTVAHSITLALATLGAVYVPAAPTEAIISLSIVFLASEIIRKYKGEKSMMERYPWVIAFIFGLFHGLGFAGALSEIGVPQHEVPLALFTFNVGVEIGQILFICVVVSVLALLRRFFTYIFQQTWKILPYGIGSIAAFWTIERVISFLPGSIPS